MKLLVDKRGKITIPKYLRDRYNLQPGIEIEIVDDNSKLILRPVHSCPACKKALPKELYERRACSACPPAEIIKIY